VDDSERGIPLLVPAFGVKWKWRYWIRYKEPSPIGEATASAALFPCVLSPVWHMTTILARDGYDVNDPAVTANHPAKKSTTPVSRLYIAPAILIAPCVSISASTGLSLRISAIVISTFFRATASTKA
jgi:hypothetical protein